MELFKLVWGECTRKVFELIWDGGSILICIHFHESFISLYILNLYVKFCMFAPSQLRRVQWDGWNTKICAYFSCARRELHLPNLYWSNFIFSCKLNLKRQLEVNESGITISLGFALAICKLHSNKQDLYTLGLVSLYTITSSVSSMFMLIVILGQVKRIYIPLPDENVRRLILKQKLKGQAFSLPGKYTIVTRQFGF